ncbi:MAG: GNAT family N-acetyltransferase, partial [Nostoc sp.]|uniref:GNAT family N-acetyltransferase n=1 Tax=Nostoc sp. TaxID=1180 RepID=UPI002FF6B3C3
MLLIPRISGVHTEMRIEPYEDSHLDAIKSLSIRAWTPVFDSLQKAMDLEVYRSFYPDWRVNQLHAVEGVCVAADTKVWVAIDSGSIMGFVAVKLHSQSSMGEIYMVAVDPDYQRRCCGHKGVGCHRLRFNHGLCSRETPLPEQHGR